VPPRPAGRGRESATRQRRHMNDRVAGLASARLIRLAGVQRRARTDTRRAWNGRTSEAWRRRGKSTNGSSARSRVGRWSSRPLECPFPVDPRLTVIAGLRGGSLRPAQRVAARLDILGSKVHATCRERRPRTVGSRRKNGSPSQDSFSGGSQLSIRGVVRVNETRTERKKKWPSALSRRAVVRVL